MQSLVTFFRKARQPGRQGSGPASARLTDWCHRISGFIGAGGIRRRLALSTAFVLLPCILAAHVALVATVNVDQQEARAQVQAEAIDLNLLIARDFENMRNLGQYLARIEPLLRHDPHQMHSVFAATIGTDANLHIALVDAAGQQLFNTRAATGAILPRLADQTGVERAIREQRALLRHVRRGNVSGHSLYSVLVPIQLDGIVERLIVVNRTTDHLMSQIIEQLPIKAWHVTVLDSSHQLVLTNALQAKDAWAPPDLLPGVPLTLAEPDDKTVTTYLRGKRTDWIVIVSANARDAVKGQWSLLVILQIGAVLLSLGIAFWTARGLIRPLSQLEELARNLETSANHPLPALAITEVRHAAETLVHTGTVLRQSRERLASIIASASDAIICIDRHGRISLFNDRAVAIFQCTRAAAFGRPIQDFLSIPLETFELQYDNARSIECIGRRGDDAFTAEISVARPVEDDEYKYSLIVRDITTAQRVALENARLAIVVEASADAIISLGLDHTVMTWNTSAERLFGYAASEIVGHTYLSVIPDELEGQYQRNCERLRMGESISLVAPRRHKDGSLVWVEVSSAPLRDATGTVVGLSTVLRDISDKIEATLLEHRLAAIVDASADAIIGLAPDCTVMTWNPAAGKLFGYSSDEIVGKSLNVLFPIAERTALEEKVYQSCQSGSASTQVERLRQDGSMVVVSGTIAAIRDADAHITGFSVVYRDMTESKRHEQQMRIVMRELSHRAKNLLAVISAMARSTTTSAPDIATYVDDFSSRLHGLARSHDLLVKKEWVGASLRALVDEQLQPFVFKSSNQLAINGADIALSPAAAQMIGLALHELATNAAKHGAFSKETGTVSISWHIVNDEDGSPQIDLFWRELGGPPVTAPRTIGFGREVLEEMLAESLDGSTSLTFAKDGVVWHLHAPLSAVEATVALSKSAIDAATSPAHFNAGQRVLAA